MIAASPPPVSLLGRYALYDAIASGGMATVHLGRLLGPIGFSRTVAVKQLHPQFAADPEFVGMFLDEARLTARLHHPNVVRTLDVVNADGTLFLVLEYVHGEPLSRLVREARARGVQPDPTILATIAAGALRGLHAAHEAKGEDGVKLGIVHRDVSPNNVLVGLDGVPRVLDFGIAKARNRVQNTFDGKVKGTLAYMAPEQLRGLDVTPTADVYAMAVVLWEGLAGEAYIGAKTPGGTVSAILERVPESLRGRRPDVPEALDRVLLRALSPDPEARFASAEAMALALEDAAGIASSALVGAWVSDLAAATLAEREARIAEIEAQGTPPPPPPPTTAPPHEAASVPTASAETEADRGPSSRAPARLLAVGAVGLALAVGAGALLRRPTAGTRAHETSIPPNDAPEVREAAWVEIAPHRRADEPSSGESEPRSRRPRNRPRPLRAEAKGRASGESPAPDTATTEHDPEALFRSRR